MQGASPLPGAVTLYRVYTGAKTPAQGHRRLVGRWRQAAAVAHRWLQQLRRCHTTEGYDHDGRFRDPRTPSPNWRRHGGAGAGRARPTPAKDAGPHSTSTAALLRTPPCNNEDDNVQHREGCTTHVSMFKTRRHTHVQNASNASPHSTVYKLQKTL